jgi:hypothetical protein
MRYELKVLRFYSYTQNIYMDGYTRAVSGQWLSKHVPVVRQQILNNATVGLQQWKSRVFCVVCAKRL